MKSTPHLRSSFGGQALLPVGLFTAAYLLIATPFALAHHNTEFLFYIGIVIGFAMLVLFLHKRANLSKGVLWTLSIWGLLHMLGGLVELPQSWSADGTHHVLYSLWIIPGFLKYDNPVHAFGFGVATWVCWQVLHGTYPKLKPTGGILTLCALAGMGLGALNEVIEFSATLLIPGTNVGGYENTAWDLVYNLIGSVVAACIIVNYKRK